MTRIKPGVATISAGAPCDGGGATTLSVVRPGGDVETALGGRPDPQTARDSIIFWHSSAAS
jgi:hypothetical protein